MAVSCMTERILPCLTTRKWKSSGAAGSSSSRSGKIARQADGAVVATYGETTVLATVVSLHEPKPGQDFFPLTVNYQEKYYASGRIPGGFFKREGRPTEKETLTSRLIDRPIRPLFAEGYKNDTQVVVTVLSHDLENDPDIVGMVAASAALTLSGVPFMGPIGGARVGYINGSYVLNPPVDQLKESKLDLVVAGTADAVLMVESEAQELAEDVMLGAVMFGHRGFQPVIDAIIRLAERSAKEPRDFAVDDQADLYARVKQSVAEELGRAYSITAKAERHDALDAAKAKVKAELCPPGVEGAPSAQLVGELFKKVESEIVRGRILEEGRRIDGRDLTTVRPIVSEAGILPRTHGSALFTRGETQALVVATLGTGEDEQMIDSLEGTYKERFMLHYNFPPYSVGETGRMGSPGRREVGHGKLAWRAVHPMLPAAHEFPYTLRVVSEITESNGSSSMATVCGTSLALMDAGVPLKVARRRHRHGPHQGGRALRRPLRHPRRRGSSRRHGLQGGRHGERRHRAADGHQDPGHHRRDHAHRPRPGQGRPPAHPRRDEQGARGSPRRARRACAAHRGAEDPGRQDPRSDRLGRQGDPRDRREDRRQGRHPGRRDGEGRLRQRRSRSARPSSGSRASRRSPRSARSTRAPS